jgi:hypothetical protein
MTDFYTKEKAMKRFSLAALVGATLLSGCASEATKPNGQEPAERGATTLGSFIPRKSAPPENVKTIDRQAYENERMMGNGTNNAPTR